MTCLHCYTPDSDTSVVLLVSGAGQCNVLAVVYLRRDCMSNMFLKYTSDRSCKPFYWIFKYLIRFYNWRDTCVVLSELTSNSHVSSSSSFSSSSCSSRLTIHDLCCTSIYAIFMYVYSLFVDYSAHIRLFLYIVACMYVLMCIRITTGQSSQSVICWSVYSVYPHHLHNRPKLINYVDSFAVCYRRISKWY